MPLWYYQELDKDWKRTSNLQLLKNICEHIYSHAQTDKYTHENKRIRIKFEKNSSLIDLVIRKWDHCKKRKPLLIFFQFLRGSESIVKKRIMAIYKQIATFYHA